MSDSHYQPPHRRGGGGRGRGSGRGGFDRSRLGNDDGGYRVVLQKKMSRKWAKTAEKS